MRFLEVRPRSVGEVRRRLTGAGYRTELVESAISRLIELGILDDEAFARSWVESRDRSRPRGEHALRRELRLKDVSADTARTVLDERRERAADASSAGDADEDAARRLLARHAAAFARVSDPRARRQRMYALLVRNGFGPEVAGRLAAEASRDGE